MIDDGKRYQHDLTARGHYDRVWAALNGTGLTMLGEHEFPGGRYDVLDSTGSKVGWVTFTSSAKPEFTGGYWYGVHIVVGRALTSRDGLADFLDQITTTHPGRVR